MLSCFLNKLLCLQSPDTAKYTGSSHWRPEAIDVAIISRDPLCKACLSHPSLVALGERDCVKGWATGHWNPGAYVCKEEEYFWVLTPTLKKANQTAEEVRMWVCCTQFTCFNSCLYLAVCCDFTKLSTGTATPEAPHGHPSSSWCQCSPGVPAGFRFLSLVT